MTISDILAVAGSPYGGFFLAGVMIGWMSAWLFITRYIVDSKIAASEAQCAAMMRAAEDVHIAQLQAMQDKLDRIEPVAIKWEQFMERKALEAIGG